MTITSCGTVWLLVLRNIAASGMSTCAASDCLQEPGQALLQTRRARSLSDVATVQEGALAKSPEGHVSTDELPFRVSSNRAGNRFIADAIQDNRPLATSVTEAFLDSGTDKLWKHGYHRYYETELAPYRDIDGLRVLEIGADSGKSLGAWLEYFKSPAAVQGIAYSVDEEAAKKNACARFPDHCDKLKIYSLDQSDVSALSALKHRNAHGWDIIIDDASHKPQHQLISFQNLWPMLRHGGLYVIEDVETSYADDGMKIYNYSLHGGIGRPPPDNAVEQFKRLVDVVNRRHFGHPEFSVFPGIDHDVSRVTFGDGLIFVQKKPDDPEWDTYPRDNDLSVKKENSDRTVAAYKRSLEKMDSWLASGGDPPPRTGHALHGRVVR